MPTVEQQYKPVTQYDMDYMCKLCTNKYVDILLEPCGCRTHTHCLLSTNLDNANSANRCKNCNAEVKKIWMREDRIGRKWHPYN
jgi:hypothetical protein